MSNNNGAYLPEERASTTRRTWSTHVIFFLRRLKNIMWSWPSTFETVTPACQIWSDHFPVSASPHAAPGIHGNFPC